MDAALIAKLLRSTQVVFAPTKTLAAYGPTRLQYHLVSPVEDLEGRTRLREGNVLSERPLILTPEILRERFSGFGEDAKEFSRWLCDQYRELLRALEYRFKNEDIKTRVLHEDHRLVLDRIKEDVSSVSPHDSVLIRCPDSAWSLALMKFTLDEAARAFPGHVRSFEEHGLFDPSASAVRRQRNEIDHLFRKAGPDPSLRSELGRKLKEYDLFSEYEDRFLSLFS
ncbi:MAG: hypothetical protein HY551_05355 [Elusimicrobia bacterium]|nr:hypothetical protein [Elusimicrobiota bacterium]